MRRLRELTLEDVPRLLELEHELFDAGSWSEWMIRDELGARGRHYLGVEVEGVLVGYAGAWFDGVDSQVMTLGVAREHQGKGLGRTLLRALLDHERERGARQVFLEVRVDNASALALYESFGFERMGLRRGYYQPGNVDAVTMRLTLPRAHPIPPPA